MFLFSQPANTAGTKLNLFLPILGRHLSREKIPSKMKAKLILHGREFQNNYLLAKLFYFTGNSKINN